MGGLFGGFLELNSNPIAKKKRRTKPALRATNRVNLLKYELVLQNNSYINQFVIAVDGHGGSGKSTLANLLSEKLKAEIIHTDDFAGWDNPLNWWPLVIERVFEPIKNGEKLLNYPRSKWWEAHNPEPVVNQPVTPIMILEGVSSLRKEFRQYISYGIFVDTPLEVCLRRGFERDRGQDGKSEDEIKEMWREWYKKEETYIEHDNPKEFADLVVDGTKSFEEQIKRIEL
jgi:uridine kinase